MMKIIESPEWGRRRFPMSSRKYPGRLRDSFYWRLSTGGPPRLFVFREIMSH